MGKGKHKKKFTGAKAIKHFERWRFKYIANGLYKKRGDDDDEACCISLKCLSDLFSCFCDGDKTNCCGRVVYKTARCCGCYSKRIKPITVRNLKLGAWATTCGCLILYNGCICPKIGRLNALGSIDKQIDVEILKPAKDYFVYYYRNNTPFIVSDILRDMEAENIAYYARQDFWGNKYSRQNKKYRDYLYERYPKYIDYILDHPISYAVNRYLESYISDYFKEPLKTTIERMGKFNLWSDSILNANQVGQLDGEKKLN